MNVGEVEVGAAAYEDVGGEEGRYRWCTSSKPELEDLLHPPIHDAGASGDPKHRDDSVACGLWPATSEGVD